VLELERFDHLRCAVALHAQLSRDEAARSAASLAVREYVASFRETMNGLLICRSRREAESHGRCCAITRVGLLGSTKA